MSSYPASSLTKGNPVAGWMRSKTQDCVHFQPKIYYPRVDHIISTGTDIHACLRDEKPQIGYANEQ